MQIMSPNSSNIESARTEKFNHQLYPHTSNEPDHLREERERERKKDAEDYNEMFEEFKAKLDWQFQQNQLYKRDWHSFDGDVIKDQY